MIKNDLFLKVLRGESVSRPPVWMMRQAGRYLPDFRKLKAQYDFFSRVQNPELASDITVMPIHQVGMDAAILFSDILVIPQAMGVKIEMQEDKGPVILNPIRDEKSIDALITENTAERLDYVMQAIRLTLQKLDNRVPLIGFAGAPWTILCYLVEGSGSKSFDKARAFCYTHPQLAHKLLEKITVATIEYLQAKISAGVHTIQLFDSWAGMLGAADYKTFSHQYNERIIQALNPRIPVILFAKNCNLSLDHLMTSGAAALGLDWTVSPQQARSITHNKIILQGNFDPARLLTNPVQIKQDVKTMISEFGSQQYIANLGHGILPHTPVENAIAFVEAVKDYQS